MPFNFYAETSFTEMCGRRYFGVRLRLQKSVRIRSCPTTRIRGRPRMVYIQSYQQ